MDKSIKNKAKKEVKHGNPSKAASLVASSIKDSTISIKTATNLNKITYSGKDKKTAIKTINEM